MITGSNNPFSCEPVVFANANTIVSLGTINRDGNEFTFSIGFVWKINGVTYQNTTPIVLTITEASEGFQRIDNAILNTSNNIELQQGLESDTIALQPVVPDTNLLLTSWIISGTTIASPPDPLIGASYFKGNWNANTNTPTLVNGVGNKGDYLFVDTQGTFQGVLYKIGDRIEFDGSNWYKAVNNNQTIDVSGKQDVSQKGQPNGYASLDENGKVPLSQLPTNSFLESQWRWTFFDSANTLNGVFNGLALNSGTIGTATVPSGIPDYQNIKVFNSSTSANSGYRYMTVTSSGAGSSRFFNQVGLTFFATFCIYANSNADTVIRIGFANTTNQIDASDGAYIEITANSVVFKTAKASSRSATISQTLEYSSSTTSEIPYDVMIYFETTTKVVCKIKKYDGTVIIDTFLNTNVPLTTVGLHAVVIGSITTAGTARPIYGLQKIGIGFVKPNFLNNF